MCLLPRDHCDRLFTTSITGVNKVLLFGVRKFQCDIKNGRQLDRYILHRPATNEVYSYFQQDTENYGPVHAVIKSKKKALLISYGIGFMTLKFKRKIWQQRILVVYLTARQVTLTLSCLNLTIKVYY
jgi:hypothetical protein